MKNRIRMNEIWKQERDFTEWLSNNMEYVGKLIGRNIVESETECKESEKNGKGKYPVDILATDDKGRKIVVENQYFLTNHVHLGEILTYSAWLDVDTIVWITESIDEEHYCAVEYMNKLGAAANSFFKFWVLLVEPDVDSDLDNDPKIKLKIAQKEDCINRDFSTQLPQNADLNKEFWDRFENEFSNENGFTISRAKRTDCINLCWGKSYYMNVPFRKKAIKIEVKFTQYPDIFLREIENDWENILEELNLKQDNTIEIKRNKTSNLLGITIPAQVKNTGKWEEYIEEMITIILLLREIVDRYEFCF